MKPAIQIGLLFVLSVSCRTSPKPRNSSFDYATRIGVVMMRSDQACLEIHNPALRTESRLSLVFTSVPQSTADARVLEGPDKSCARSDASDEAVHAYRVHTGTSNPEPSMPAIAISDFSRSFGKMDGLIFTDLEGDGQQNFFRSCTSAEGVHFTVWSGKPLKGKLKWHQYYYLGYDVDANCTPPELKSAN